MEANHILHSGYCHKTLRKIQSTSTAYSKDNLMYPLFIVDELDAFQEISSMPNVHRIGVNRLVAYVEPLVKKGLASILLFGVATNLAKDETGTNADSVDNPVVQALPLLRNKFPTLLIACDVCLCPYTNHGHCGILRPDGIINNELSIKRLAEIALSYAKAGAHIVAPSDMMDGRIAAIKSALISSGLGNQVSVLSYSVKFASNFYGPFRDACKSAPSFGDRKNYQLPSGSSGLARRAAQRDVEEGADMLMVKPGLPYLDMLKVTKQDFPNHPLFVYQVSGEYSMLYAAYKAGVLDLRGAVEEVIVSFRRAGADCIITYFTPLLLDWLSEA